MVQGLENILLTCQDADSRANRLINALTNVDIIICDEIGPMELKSKEFIDAARNLITTDKNVIVHSTVFRTTYNLYYLGHM